MKLEKHVVSAGPISLKVRAENEQEHPHHTEGNPPWQICRQCDEEVCTNGSDCSA